jgi:hypothetical protein
MSAGGYRPGAYDGDERRHTASIPLYLVLTILTLGIFNLYWNYRQMQSCNEMLDRDEFSFVLWLLLVIVTCGLYHFYYQYKMGAAINEIQERHDLPFTEGLPVLSLVAAVLGVGIVADCIHQHELNAIDAAW